MMNGGENAIFQLADYQRVIYAVFKVLKINEL